MQNLLALPNGTELVEDYRIMRVLGAGGFGLTYLAREETLDRSVTIKEYFPSDFAARDKTMSVRPRSVDAEADYGWGLERFIEEAQTLARFDHPNINRVYRYFRANNTAYIVLQFEEGQSFKSWLTGLGRAPRQAELDGIIGPLLDALEIIHKGNYLHRDIAPDNIIIRKSGAPVLIDFGSARGEMVQLSKTVSALVKPGYSPYEQYGISGRQQGPWTDIYSLGASLYQAIAGKRPTDAPTRMMADDYKPAAQVALSSYRPQFLAAIDHALKLRVEDRPQSIADWRRTLLPAAEKEPAKARLSDKAKPAAEIPARAASPTAPLDQAASPPKIPNIFARGKGDVPDAVSPKPSGKASAISRTSLKKRLVRVLEGVAARPDAVLARNGAPPVADKRPALPVHPSAEAEAARALPVIAAPLAARHVVIAPKPAAGSKGKLRGWRLLRRSVAALPRPVDDPPKALAKAAVPAPYVPPSKAAPSPKRRSRSVALKLLAGATLSAVLLSYQDQIRTAWLAHGWTAAPATSQHAHKARVPLRAHQDKKTDVRSAAVPGAIASATLASSTVDGDSPPRPPEEHVLRGHRGTVTAVGFLSDGSALASIGQDGTLRLWDVTKHELIRTVEAGDGLGGAFAVQDRIAAIGHRDGTIALWDLDRGQRLSSFKRNDAAIWSVTFAGDVQHVLGASHDWAAALWSEQRDAGPQHLFEGHDNAVQAVAYSSRGVQSGTARPALVATGGADKLIKLWNAIDYTLIRTLRGHRDFVSSLAFSLDGGYLASGSFDKVVRIWSTNDSGSNRTLRGHKGRITSVAFSPDGSILASASEDGTVRLWDWKRSRVTRTLAGHSGSVRSVVFSTDGKTIATAGDDGTIRLWDTTSLSRTASTR